MRFDFKSIRFKLWFYLTASVVVSMALLWVLQAILMPYLFLKKRTYDLKQAAGTLLSAYGTEDFSSVLENTAYQYNVSAEVINADGSVGLSVNMFGLRNPFVLRDGSGSVHVPPPMRPLYSRYIDSVNKSADGTLFTSVKNERYGNMTLLYAMKTPDGYLFLNAELKPSDSIAILRELAFITAIVVVISSLAAIFIAGSISRPITRITEASRLLLKNEFPDHCGGSFSETRELAGTLRQTASELKKVENLRRDFIANVSHDLRTPLTMIKAYGEAARDLISEDPEQKNKDLSIIIQESDRLASLVDDLLELSRMQAGHGELLLAPLNLTRLIENAINSYSIRHDRDGYDLVFEHDAEVTVAADEKRILQVIHNLITNAINHTGPDKRVVIRQLTLPGGVRIEVCDTGPGIPPDQLPYIWDRYFRGEQKRTVSGNGLGLSIIKNVLELHGARYGVESPEQGGSVFWFELVR